MDEKIKIQVIGEIVEGIVSATFNNIRVAITYPYEGIAEVSHQPYFALPFHQFTKDEVLTPYGYKSAQWYLQEVYEQCVFVEANEDELIVECQNFLEQGIGSLFMNALRGLDFPECWSGLPILLLVFWFSDWMIVDQCRDALNEKFGRRLPEDLVRRLLARARWLEQHAS